MRYKIYKDHNGNFLPMKTSIWRMFDLGEWWVWDYFHEWIDGPIISFASLEGAKCFIKEYKEGLKRGAAEAKARRSDEKSRTYYL